MRSLKIVLLIHRGLGSPGGGITQLRNWIYQALLWTILMAVSEIWRKNIWRDLVACPILVHPVKINDWWWPCPHGYVMVMSQTGKGMSGPASLEDLASKACCHGIYLQSFLLPLAKLLDSCFSTMRIHAQQFVFCWLVQFTAALSSKTHLASYVRCTNVWFVNKRAVMVHPLFGL